MAQDDPGPAAVPVDGRTLFRVARNPDPESTLPYVLWLPLAPTPMALLAADTFPRTAKVYCHRADWPEEPDLVEQVAVRSCTRRGMSIDLVLDRGRENRSQFVITTLKGGREGIFWQTRNTSRKTRPGMRLPAKRSAAGVLHVLVDTRERHAWKFDHQQATTEKKALRAGDYGVERDGEVIAVVERKKLAELAGDVVDGRLLVTLADLATVGRAAIVVEDRWADVFRLRHVAPAMVAEMLAAAQVRFPTVPLVFCETRTLAQEWSYRFLGAALAFADEEAVPLDQ